VRLDSQRDQAVGLNILAGLLEAGLPDAEALAAVSDRLSTSGIFEGASRLVEGGVSLSEALKRSAPPWAELLAGDDQGLPQRLRALSQHELLNHTLQGQLRGLSLYPSLLAFALLFINLGLFLFHQLHFPPLLFGGAPNGAQLLSYLLLPGSFLLLLHAVWRLRQGRQPLWARLLPGHQVWPLSEMTRLLSLYRLYRTLAKLSPLEALRRSLSGDALKERLEGEELAPALKQLKLPLSTAAALLFIEESGDLEQGMEALIQRNEQERERAAGRLLLSMGQALILAAGLGVLLTFLLFYSPIFGLAGTLS